MTHYAALDVSLRSVAICIIDNEGIIRLETSVPSEVEDITAVLDSFDGTIVSVGLEAEVLTQYPPRSYGRGHHDALQRSRYCPPAQASGACL
jgi:hypothetical protein